MEVPRSAHGLIIEAHMSFAVEPCWTTLPHQAYDREAL